MAGSDDTRINGLLSGDVFTCVEDPRVPLLLLLLLLLPFAWLSSACSPSNVEL